MYKTAGEIAYDILEKVSSRRAIREIQAGNLNDADIFRLQNLMKQNGELTERAINQIGTGSTSNVWRVLDPKHGDVARKSYVNTAIADNLGDPHPIMNPERVPSVYINKDIMDWQNANGSDGGFARVREFSPEGLIMQDRIRGKSIEDMMDPTWHSTADDVMDEKAALGSEPSPSAQARMNDKIDDISRRRAVMEAEIGRRSSGVGHNKLIQYLKRKGHAPWDYNTPWNAMVEDYNPQGMKFIDAAARSKDGRKGHKINSKELQTFIGTPEEIARKSPYVQFERRKARLAAERDAPLKALLKNKRSGGILGKILALLGR